MTDSRTAHATMTVDETLRREVANRPAPALAEFSLRQRVAARVLMETFDGLQIESTVYGTGLNNLIDRIRSHQCSKELKERLWLCLGLVRKPPQAPRRRRASYTTRRPTTRRRPQLALAN